MPPKKDEKAKGQKAKKEPEGPSKKTELKEKNKILEDKTFGLKNKNKSKVVQNQIKGIAQQVMGGGNVKGGERKQIEDSHKDKAAKKKEEERKNLMSSLFGLMKVQTVVKKDAEGNTVDPKYILCPMFKQGMCSKGKKCKNSHDLTNDQAKKTSIDIYSDPRVKLGKMPDTIITCKDFISAVEKDLYGFNWVCPNKGDDCIYRHMLPQGYVLDRDSKGPKEGDSDDDLTLEEKIEEDRALLKSDECTPCTAETFKQWKIDKAAKKQKELEDRITKESMKGKKDKTQLGFMSGKALFSFDPNLFQDDDDAVDDEMYDEAGNEDRPREEGKEEETEAENKANMAAAEEDKPMEAVDQELFAAENAGEEDEDIDFD